MKLRDGVLTTSAASDWLDPEVLDSAVESKALVLVGILPVELAALELPGFSPLLTFALLQDLQHIWRYPGLEQYRLSASIRQNTERSARQRCLEEMFEVGKSVLDLDNH